MPEASLRRLAVLGIVLPVLVLGAIAATRYGQIRTETEVRLDRALRIAREHALKVVDINETTLAHVMDLLGDTPAGTLRSRESSLHLKLREMTRNKPQIQSLWVLDSDGRPIAGDRFFPSPATLNVADRAYFRWHEARRGGLYISETLVGRATGTPFVDMSRGRYGPEGDFEGVVSISLLPPYFEDFHRDLAADEPGLAITMFRQDGAILTRYPPLANAPPTLSPTSPVMSRIRDGVVSGDAAGISSVDGRQRLLTFARVGDYPLYVGTGMDVAEIHRRWRTEMLWLMLIGLPPLIGLFLAARLALRRTREALDSARRLHEETVVRQRVEESLVQSQKLEALGRLTGGVAHDFNNALMVISSNLYLLQRKSKEGITPQLDAISRSVESATKLTRQLLAFSRRQALVPVLINLEEQLPLIRDLIRPVLGGQITLSVETVPGTHPIIVDSSEFELALINLAINARDAMPDGGSFRIVAQDVSDRRPPLLEGPLVVIEAADTGAGIDPTLIDRVFEPFFTTKPVGQGTGLGLSQIYGMCKRAGGLATIESAVGKGAVVRMYFPRAAHSTTSAADCRPVVPHRLERSVVLVEDNDAVASALVPVLQDLGCTVTRFDRADAADAWLAKQDRLPDLLLTDIVMPGAMDGFALARRARARYPRLKILMMTGYAEQLDAISGMGFEVLPKPCSAEILGTAIDRLTRPP